MRVRPYIIALALLAGAATVHAQDRTLERVQNMITTGRLTEARNTLNQWERDHGSPASTASSDDRARAMYLDGLLSSNVATAEDRFITVVLTWPSSPVAPEALLRLGQALYTSGDADRAIMYLERLRSDYPRSSHRETGMLWLARAQLAAGDAAAACGTTREGLFGVTNDNVRTLIELERDRACAQSGGVATGPASRDRPRTDAGNERAQADSRPVRALDSNPMQRTGTPAAADAPRTPETPRAADTPRAAEAARTAPTARATPLPDLEIAVDANVREPSSGDTRTADRTAPRDDRTGRTPARDEQRDTRAEPGAPGAQPAAATAVSSGGTAVATGGPEFAIQSAAFSERRSADVIAAEMRARGLVVRIVQVPGSPLFRVRYGAFMTSREASDATLIVRDAGFATLIVNDVRLERQP